MEDVKALLVALLLAGCTGVEDTQIRYDWVCGCRLVWVDDGTSASYWPNDGQRPAWEESCSTEDEITEMLEADPDECGCVSSDPCL